MNEMTKIVEMCQKLDLFISGNHKESKSQWGSSYFIMNAFNDNSISRNVLRLKFGFQKDHSSIFKLLLTKKLYNNSAIKMFLFKVYVKLVMQVKQSKLSTQGQYYQSKRKYILRTSLLIIEKKFKLTERGK